MQHKSVNFIIQGMQRDLSIARFDQNFAYENMNIRLTAIDDKSLLSVTNERGTKKLSAKNNDGSDLSILGNYIGHTTVGKYLILFTHEEGNNIDYIYKFYIESDVLYGHIVTYGNLGFDEEYPIEAIGIYETDYIQKVYWVDGKNPVRYINIADDKHSSGISNSSVFDFTGDVPFPSYFKVTKHSETAGSFQSGIIQYAYSFYDKNGRESNIVDVSPLLYISEYDRGGNAETICKNSFKIELVGIPDNNIYKYDYIRLYSIHRSSIDAVPTIKNIIDIKLDYLSEGQNISYIDTGNYGITEDAYSLLFKGGESIIPKTLVQKDNTLFLGNYKTNSNLVEDDLKVLLKASTISFTTKTVEILNNAQSLYSYKFQLSKDSYTITSYKQGETYRFGVQLQNKAGKWSEVIYIQDATVPYILSGVGSYEKLILPILSLTTECITALKSSNYIKIRGVVVFPQAEDRTIVAQGILCPTVFNLANRVKGNVYAQSSWFARPMSNESMYNLHTIEGTNFKKGATMEFRHEYVIPMDNNSYNMEIGVLPKGPNVGTSYENPWGSEVKNYYSNENSLHYVDQNVVTFHSPEFVFSDNYNLNNDSLKLRIVGFVPLTASSGATSIQMESAGFNSTVEDDLTVNHVNESTNGHKSLISGPFFRDGSYLTKEEAEESGITQEGGSTTIKNFVVYPWHRNGSLNDFPKSEKEFPRNAIYKNKKISNLRYSNNTIYFDNDTNKHWEAFILGDSIRTGITPVTLFNSDQNTIIKIKKPLNSTYLSDLVYAGNVDTVLTGSNPIYTLPNSNSTIEKSKIEEFGDPVSMKYKSTPHAVFAFNYTSDGKMRTLPALTSINITTRNLSPIWLEASDSFIQYVVNEKEGYTGSYDYEVVAFGYLPDPNDPLYEGEMCFYDGKFVKYDFSAGWVENTNPSKGDIVVYNDYKDSNKRGIYYEVDELTAAQYELQTDILNYTNKYGGFYIAELYKDIDSATRFGGTSNFALENNIWYPAGEATFISTLDSNTPIKYSEGDTYYQRFDCMKTYPYTQEDQNSIIEIVSFMCETRENIEGRWDRNRGQVNNINMSPTNFNLFNPVYNQKNNFFNYRILPDDYNITEYPTSITWTLSKTLGEKIDSWTKINLTSLLDLDGNNGALQKLQILNNEIFSFQNKGIAKILFNSRVQIPTSEGVPIEIANSGKVDGKIYITQEVGTINKSSVITTPNGIYFIDNNNFGIYNLSNGLVCISDKLNMSSIIKEHSNMKEWNPKNFNNFKCFYDRINADVYFVNKEICLCFNELLGQFTSFYNYEGVPMMCNIEDKFLMFKNTSIWEAFKGDYNSFFDEIKPFYITYIANPEPTKDKIFNNIELRTDTYYNDTLLNRTFDTIEVWNEYQRGKSKMTNVIGKPSNTKNKFRVWRTQIPRHNNTLDRIRNPWCYIKLSMDNPSNYKTIFYDATLSYSV